MSHAIQGIPGYFLTRIKSTRLKLAGGWRVEQPVPIHIHGLVIPSGQAVGSMDIHRAANSYIMRGNQDVIYIILNLIGFPNDTEIIEGIIG